MSNKAELVMVHELADGTLQITALNFSGEAITGSVRSEHLPGGARLTDMFTGEELGTVDDLHTFSLSLEAYSGRSLLVTPAMSAPQLSGALPRISRRCLRWRPARTGSCRPSRRASRWLAAACATFAQEHGATADDVVDLTLAVTEAVTNSVIHAFIDRDPGTVRVAVSTAADELTVVVADNGRGMQPRADSPGLGLGLPTIGRLAALRGPARGAGRRHRALDDVRDARRARARARRCSVDAREPELLDAVSRVAQGAWPGEGVERLVDLLVPAVADACAVDVIGASGHPERFAGRIDGSEEHSRWLATLRPRADARPLRHARRAGGRPPARLRAHAGPDRAASPPAPTTPRTMAATGIRWWVVIPLREGDRLLGLLHFGLLPARGRPVRRARRVPARRSASAPPPASPTRS